MCGDDWLPSGRLLRANSFLTCAGAARDVQDGPWYLMVYMAFRNSMLYTSAAAAKCVKQLWGKADQSLIAE